MAGPTLRLRERLRRWAGALKREVVALWFAARDPRTPWWPRLLCAIVVAYALSPIDLIPDFIPVLGYLDDLLLLPALIWLTLRAIPAALMDDCRRRADAWLQAGSGRPRSAAGAVAIVLLWALAAGLAGWWWLPR